MNPVTSAIVYEQFKGAVFQIELLELLYYRYRNNIMGVAERSNYIGKTSVAAGR